MKIHTTATWSAREDRGAALVWLALIWVGMLLGFGFDLKRYFHEAPPAHWVVHIHAVVFTLWLFVLTAMITLVERDKVQVHRKLGWYVAGMVCVMTVLGPLAFLTTQAVNLHTPAMYDPQFFGTSLTNGLNLFLLTAWGVLERKNPAAHRRLMILATVAIVDPGYSRITGLLWPVEPHSIPVWYPYTYYGNLMIMLLMFLWDWKKGRLMRQFVIGAAWITLTQMTVSSLYFWAPWKALTAGWVEAYARWFHLG